MFAKLKESIEGPLKGMATAFGASLFGLSGSLVLGFLELQASQAQGRFHIELEEWLAGATRLSSGAQVEGEQGVSAYVEALLERTADGLDDLTRTLRRAEEGREATAAPPAPPWSNGWRRWPRRCAASRRCWPAWPSSRSSCARRSTASPSAARPTTTARRWPRTSAPSRAISAGWSRRMRAAGRPSATSCGSSSSACAERSSDEDREALLTHQRAIEGHLARLVEENVRNRTALADELRGEFRLLARTIASTARGAVQPPGDG